MGISHSRLISCIINKSDNNLVLGPDPNSKGVINGVGLYYVGSMFNHSCDPNAAFIARYEHIVIKGVVVAK